MSSLETAHLHRESSRRERQKREAYMRGRHTIAEVRFSVRPMVSCSCGWVQIGPDTEAAWKAHKFDVGERNFR